MARRRRPARRVGPASKREQDRAARKLQGLFRTREARRRLRLLLRSVFEKVYDPATGAYYFHNLHTGDVSWEKPALLGSEDFDEIGDQRASPHDKVRVYEGLARAWAAYEDEESGASYFYNASTEETTWTKPEVLERLEESIAERDEMLGPDWSASLDEEGNTYFYNQVTGESTWEPPPVDFRKTKEQKIAEAKEAKRKERELRRLERQRAKAGSRGSSRASSRGRSPASKASSGAGSDNDDGLDSVGDEDGAGDGAAAVSGAESGGGDSDASDEAEASGDDDTVYVSTDDEARAVQQEREARPGLSERKRLAFAARRARRDAQRERYHGRLAELVSATAAERRAFELRVRLKRCRVRRAQRLDASRLKLQAMPSELFEEPLATQVCCVDFGLNLLTHIDFGIKAMRENLTELVLDSNCLHELPVQLFYCVNLQHLDVRNNRIRSIPREKGNMQVLREMNVWEIGIETLTDLRSLRLDNNMLQSIPPEITSLSKLVRLTARENRIHELPSEGLGDLVSLRVLDLSKNFLDKLPEAGFGRLASLEVLLLGDNALRGLPPSIGQLQGLRVLDVASNKLQMLPSSFGELRALESLQLQSNEIEALPEDWSSHIGRTLRSLDASRNRLERLPESFGQMPLLEHLDVSFNRLKPRLPSSIACMTRLVTLKARGNQLEQTGFDEACSAMQSLVEVDLADNRLKRIHALLVYGCRALCKLDLSGNRLTQIPARPDKGPAAGSGEGGPRWGPAELDLSRNELTSIPGCIFEALPLVQITCVHNRLTALPPEISASATTLERLELDHNKLKSLPGSLSSMQRLRFVSLDHNLLGGRPAVLEALACLRHWQANFNPIELSASTHSRRLAMVCEADLHRMKREPEAALGLLSTVLEEITGCPVDAGPEEEDVSAGNQEGEQGSAAAAAAAAATATGSGVAEAMIEVGKEEVIGVADLAEDPELRAEHELLRQVRIKRGQVLLSLERFSEAEQAFGRALGMMDQPTFSLLYQRGIAQYFGSNDAVSALANFDAAISLKPDFAQAYRARAACLLDLGHYDKALSDAKVALDADLFDPDAWFRKGAAEERLQHFDSALASYKRVIQLAMEAHEREKLRSQLHDAKREDDPGSPQAVDRASSEAESRPELDDAPTPAAVATSPTAAATRVDGAAAREEMLQSLSPWSPVGAAYYRSGLVLRDLNRAKEAVAQFQCAADVLYVQVEKARQGTVRRRKLGELLRMAVVCRASALQSANRTKRAMLAWQEAQRIKQTTSSE